MQDKENPTQNFASLPSTTRAVASAFRSRNVLTGMMLNEVFNTFKDDEEETV